MSNTPTATRRLHPITFFAEEAVHRPLEDRQETKFRLLVRCAGFEYNITAEEFDSADEAAQTLVDYLELICEQATIPQVQEAIAAGVTAASRELNRSIEQLRTDARAGDTQLGNRIDRMNEMQGAHLHRLEALNDVAVAANQIAVSAKGVADSAHSAVGTFSLQLKDHVNKRKH